LQYATLYEVRSYRGFAEDEATGDDARLTRLLNGACRAIDALARRTFYPRHATLHFNYPVPQHDIRGALTAEMWIEWMYAAQDISQGRLRFLEDLLEVTGSIVNGDDTTISADDYVLEPANVYPKHAIRLKRGHDVRWQPGDNGERKQIIDVPGIWGYHTDYANAWVDTLDTLQTEIDASESALSVADADGTAGDLESPRIQPGNLLRLEDEFVDVVTVDYDTNEITVQRGAYGSTAAVHDSGTTIEVWRPTENIRQATLRMVIWRYTQKDVDAYDTTEILGTGVRVVPSAVPADILALLPLQPENLNIGG
jgi:hypothetical protein